MGKIDEFKSFVKDNPILISHVKDGSMTWQNFYEIYDLYGDSKEAWDQYLSKKEEVKPTSTESTTSNDNSSLGGPWSSILNMAKNLDADKMQTGITSLQKALGLVGELFTKEGTTTAATTAAGSTYRPRPTYRRFED